MFVSICPKSAGTMSLRGLGTSFMLCLGGSEPVQPRTLWFLGLPPILYKVWNTDPHLDTHVWAIAWEMSIRLCASGFGYMQRIPEQLLLLWRALWVKLVLSPQLPFGCLLKHWTAVLLSMWSVHVWQSIKLQKILWEDCTFQNLKQSSPS